MTGPIGLESNQNHATTTQNGVCPTLPASMGMGGGYVPMIAYAFDPRGNGGGAYPRLLPEIIKTE